MKSWVLVLGLAAFGGASARADIVHLDNGSTLEGVVTRKDGKVYIERPDGTIILDEERVDYIEEQETVLEVYRSKAEGIEAQNLNGPAAAEPWVKLAQWAASHELKNQAEAAYRRALDADPEQQAARLALGYVRYAGLWMSYDQAQRSRGLVRHGEAWVTPEAEADLLKLEAEKELEQARAQTEQIRAEREAQQYRQAETSRYVPQDYGYSYPSSYGSAYAGSSWESRRGYYPYAGGLDTRARIGFRSGQGVPTIGSRGNVVPVISVRPCAGLGVPTVSVISHRGR